MSGAAHATIIGAGLSGALMATLLAQRGWRVDVFERRGDPRVHGFAGGRSINLALAERGLHALRAADAHGAVLRQAVMMRGRMVHPLEGEPQLQRYGRDDSEVIWSVSRGELNITLIHAAEAAGAVLHFDRRLESVDFDARVATYRGDLAEHRHPFRTLIGCDGAGSTLRTLMGARESLGERTEWLGHGYKELEIPPAADGGFRIEPNALHIWPRGRYMCIALPNDERTFTVTLFMALHADGSGDPDFDSVAGAADARALFARDFADALPLIPALGHDFEANPVGTLGTLHLERWHLGGDAVLIGDAAHAMVPFQAQGAAMGIEDAAILAPMLIASQDAAAAFAKFAALRRPRVEWVARVSRANGRIFHLEWPFSTARNLVIAAQGSRAHLKRLDWLYGYDATGALQGEVNS
jgi:kynurenine 3-monooxygenase